MNPHLNYLQKAYDVASTAPVLEWIKNIRNRKCRYSCLVDRGTQKNVIYIEQVEIGLDRLFVLRFNDQNHVIPLRMDYVFYTAQDEKELQQFFCRIIDRLIKTSQFLESLRYKQDGILSFSHNEVQIEFDGIGIGETDYVRHLVRMRFNGEFKEIDFNRGSSEEDFLLATKNLESSFLITERIPDIDKRIVDWIIKELSIPS